MNKEKTFKKGDAIQFEYRDTYDRETGIGIVVEIEDDNFYKVVLIHGKHNDWAFTNYEASLPAYKLRPLDKKISDFGLSF